MKRTAKSIFSVLALAATCILAALGVGAAPPEAPKPALPSVLDARARARLLHETIHASLHVVHHQYYREEEGLELPAAAFKNVFRELADRQDVELRWLVVEGQPMNVAHQAQDEFERNAVKAIASGSDEYEAVENGVYRRAGAITLTSECLKCHLPNRTSTKDRSAGLVIAMPVSER